MDGWIKWMIPHTEWKFKERAAQDYVKIFIGSTLNAGLYQIKRRICGSKKVYKICSTAYVLWLDGYAQQLYNVTSYSTIHFPKVKVRIRLKANYYSGEPESIEKAFPFITCHPFSFHCTTEGGGSGGGVWSVTLI